MGAGKGKVNKVVSYALAYDDSVIIGNKKYDLDSLYREVASLMEKEDTPLSDMRSGELLTLLSDMGVDLISSNVDFSASTKKNEIFGDTVAEVVNNVTSRNVYDTYVTLVDDFMVKPQVAMELISNKLSYQPALNLSGKSSEFKEDMAEYKNAGFKVENVALNTYMVGDRVKAKDVLKSKGKDGLEPSNPEFKDVIKRLNKNLDTNSFTPISEKGLDTFLGKATYTVYQNDKIVGSYYYDKYQKDSIKATMDASYSILQSLDDLRPKDIDVSLPKKIIKLQPGRTQKGLQAFYTPMENSFTLTDSNIGTPIFGERINNNNFNIGYKGIGSTLIHEYGHYIDKALRRKDRKMMRDFFDRTVNMTAVSKYGNKLKEEAFAEAFVVYCHGCDYPEHAEPYMKEFRQLMKNMGLTSYENSFSPKVKAKKKPKETIKVVDKKVSKKETKKIVDDIFTTTPVDEPKVAKPKTPKVKETPEPKPPKIKETPPKKAPKPKTPVEEPKPVDRMDTLIAKYSKYKTTSTLTKDFKAGKITQAEYDHVLNALGKNTKTAKAPTPPKSEAPKVVATPEPPKVKTPKPKAKPKAEKPKSTEAKVKKETKKSAVAPTKEQKKPTTTKKTPTKKSRVKNTYSTMDEDKFNDILDGLLDKYK